MKRIALKLSDKLFEETNDLAKVASTDLQCYIKIAIEQYNRYNKKKAIEEQIKREVELLKEFDPDKELIQELELASLTDLQKYLDD